MSESGARALRAKLSHPVIDADGHWNPYWPVVTERLRRIGGDLAVRGFTEARERHSLRSSLEERRRRRIAQGAFWGEPTRNTLDRATSMLPRLLYERLDELGIDFAVLYATGGAPAPQITDGEVRRAACRALNIFSAEFFQEFSARMTPAAVIPMHTPDEAIEELEYVTGALGLKVAMFGSLLRRPIAAPGQTAGATQWLDMLGLDSEHNYDPVWDKCRELGISPTMHAGSRGMGLRVSPSNFVYNHIGHFAAAGEAVCKALFLGGVTRRFPEVKFAFLEGGAAWACELYAALIGHWNLRHREALEAVRPSNLDSTLLLELAERYGDEAFVRALQQGEGIGGDDGPSSRGGVEEIDDFAACAIQGAEDICGLFVDSFYFGCEADDPMNAWAFARKFNPFGAKLNTMFGSDIGHFDVPDMAQVVPEAHELVEDGGITEEDFRSFTFDNPVRFFGGANPRFFEGTVIERAAAEVLAS